MRLRATQFSTQTSVFSYKKVSILLKAMRRRNLRKYEIAIFYLVTVKLTTIHKFTMKTREMAIAAARIKPLPLIFFVVAFFAFLPRVVQITMFSPT
jgi:hypothetical protein